MPICCLRLRGVKLVAQCPQFCRMGVLRVADPQVFRGQRFDNLAQLHDRDDWAQMRYDREVVADHNRGQAPVRLQVGEQVQYLGLYRHIEGAGGLIKQQDVRFGHQGAGNGDPLALTAG